MKTLVKTGLGLMMIVLVFGGCKESDDTTVTPTPTNPTTPTTPGAASDILTAMSSTTATTNCGSVTGLAKVVCLAEAFKATLDATQLAATQLAYTKTDAVKWSNFPQGATTSQAGRRGAGYAQRHPTGRCPRPAVGRDGAGGRQRRLRRIIGRPWPQMIIIRRPITTPPCSGPATITLLCWGRPASPGFGSCSTAATISRCPTLTTAARPRASRLRSGARIHWRLLR